MNDMIKPELIDILRCPIALKEGTDPDRGRLRLVKDTWLVADDSGCKYPIIDGIPVMLPDEGLKWRETAESDLPVPPPQPSA